MPGVAECALKDNCLVYADIRGYQVPCRVQALGHDLMKGCEGQ